MQPSHRRPQQAPSPEPKQAHASQPASIQEPFIPLWRLKAPSGFSREHNEAEQHRSDESSPKNPLLFAGSIAGLNAKIALGYAAALSTLGTLAGAAGTAIFHTASSGGLLASAAIVVGLAVSNRLNRRSVPNEQDQSETGLPAEHPLKRRVQAIATSLCKRHNVPEPHILVKTDSIAEAFLADRVYRKDSLVISSRLVAILDDRELQGVIAHELSHQNRLFNWAERITAWIEPKVNSLVWCGGVACFSAVSPTIGIILALPVAVSAVYAALKLTSISLGWCKGVISRHNELKTDLHACKMTGDPEAFMSGFRKLQQDRSGMDISSETHPSFTERATNIRKVFGC